MYYFIYYKLFPMLARYKTTWLYTGLVSILICFSFFWVYVFDAFLKKKILFYDKKLIEIQEKKDASLRKKNTIESLIEQKEKLSLHINTEQKEVVLLWDQIENFFSKYAHKNNLIIDTLSITKQNIKPSYAKKIVSLSLQGPLNNVISFLATIETSNYFLMEDFSLHLDSKTNALVSCVFSIKKLKSPSTLNKLKG